MYSEEKSISKNVIILAILAVLSSLASLIIQELVAYKFGATFLTDAYIVASMIPLIVSHCLLGGIIYALIPAIIKIKVQKDPFEAQRVASSILNIVLLIVLVLSIFFFLFTRQIINLIAPGLSSQAKYQAIIMSRILIPNFFLFCLLLFYKAVFNANKYFILPALSPLFYSAVIFISVIILSGKMGIYSLALGTLLGSALQTLILTNGLNKINFKLSPSLLLKHPAVKAIFLLSLPVFIQIILSNINVVVLRFFASRIQEGGIASLNFSEQIINIFLSVFAGSLSVVILPYFSQQVAENEIDKLKSLFIKNAKAILIIAMPLSVILWVFSYPIVSILFERGAFDAKASHLTALNLKYYSFGFLATAISMLLMQVYYSLGKMLLLCKIEIVSVILNILLALILSGYLKTSGIALSVALTANVTFIVLFYLLAREWRLSIINKNIIKFFLKIVLASLFMAMVSQNIFFYLEGNKTKALTLKPQMLPFVLAIISALLVFLGMLILLKVKEVKAIKGLIKINLFRREPSLY